MRLDSDGVMLYPSSYLKGIFWQDQMGYFTAHYGLAMTSKGIQDKFYTICQLPVNQK